jgi:hypothetical protein
MKKCTLLIVAALLASLLVGCSKKSTKPTVSDFGHPSPKLLQDIATRRGWQIEDVEAQHRAWDAFDSAQQPSEADWQRLVRAADTEKNGFDLELAMMFSRHITDKYRAPVLGWCERNMEQTNDPYAAVVGYDCYVRSGGTDRDSWASRLKARGPFYVEKIDFYDIRELAREKSSENSNMSPNTALEPTPTAP